MRFITLIKSRENSHAGPPPASLFEALATLGAEAARAGVLVDTAGLLPTAAGARIRLSHGTITTIDGSVATGQEVVGAYALFEVPSKQQAIEWATRFMALHKKHWDGWEGETEVRQVLDDRPLTAA